MLQLVRVLAPNVYAMGVDLLAPWLKVRPIIRASGDLDDPTIDELEDNIETFSHACDNHNVALPVKGHALTAHLVSFAHRHLSIGRFTESLIEQVHQVVRRVEASFVNVNGSAQLRAIASRWMALWMDRSVRVAAPDRPIFD